MKNQFTLVVKINNNCNMHCDYCYYFSNNNINESSMPREIIKKMIAGILDYNSKYVKFMWHGGEPLLSGLDTFKYIVDIQNRLNVNNLIIMNTVQTNGLLLNEDWIKFFSKNNFNIGISLDGPYSLCRHRNITRADFYKILDMIKLLNKYHAHLGILTVVTKESVENVKDILDFYIENNIHNIKLSPCVVVDNDGNVDEKISISPKEYGQFLSHFFDLWLDNEEANIAVENFDELIKKKYSLNFCHSHRLCYNTLTVLPSGSIYSCDKFFLNEAHLLGHIDTGFQKILTNSRFNTFASAVNELSQDCIDCKFFKLCGGGCSYHRWIMKRNFKSKQYFCTSNKQFFTHVDKVLESMNINIENN